MRFRIATSAGVGSAESAAAPETERDTRFAPCDSCGSSHLRPVPCGLSFADRLRTTQVSEKGFETVERRRYFDSEMLDDAFGTDRRERMLQETRGLGPVQTAADGSKWVFDDPKTGAMRPLERSDVIGGYLRGSEEDEEA